MSAGVSTYQLVYFLERVESSRALLLGQHVLELVAFSLVIPLDADAVSSDVLGYGQSLVVLPRLLGSPFPPSNNCGDYRKNIDV